VTSVESHFLEPGYCLNKITHRIYYDIVNVGFTRKVTRITNCFKKAYRKWPLSEPRMLRYRQLQKRRVPVITNTLTTVFNMMMNSGMLIVHNSELTDDFVFSPLDFQSEGL